MATILSHICISVVYKVKLCGVMETQLQWNTETGNWSIQYFHIHYSNDNQTTRFYLHFLCSALDQLPYCSVVVVFNFIAEKITSIIL